MKKRVANKRSKRDQEILQGMYTFVRDLVDRLAGLYQEVEEYHRLKEHLLIVLPTKKPRYTLQSDDPELSFIYSELDKLIISPKNDKPKDASQKMKDKVCHESKTLPFPEGQP